MEEVKFLILIMTSKNNTSLFHMQPIELGTAFGESLSSYLGRLANAHNISIYTLLDEGISSKVLSSADSYRTVNGIGDWIPEFLSELNKSIYPERWELMTLITLKEAISPYNLCEQERKWCPECLNEWHREGKILYEPLIWIFKDIDICPVHKINLRRECPCCGAKTRILLSQFNPGYCRKCNTWLGTPAEDYIIKLDNLDQKLYFAHSIMALLNTLPYRKPPIIQHILHAIEKIIHIKTEKNIKLFCRIYGILPANMSHWFNQKHKPSLNALLLLGYKVKINFIDLIYNNTENINKIKYQSCITKTQRKPQKKVTFAEIKEYLESIINDKPPPPIKIIAKNLGCDPKKLYVDFPALTKQISQKRTEQRIKTNKNRLKEQKKIIRTIVRELALNHIYPSARKVREMAKDPYILMDPRCYNQWTKCRDRYIAKLGIPISKRGPKKRNLSNSI